VAGSFLISVTPQGRTIMIRQQRYVRKTSRRSEWGRWSMLGFQVCEFSEIKDPLIGADIRARRCHRKGDALACLCEAVEFATDAPSDGWDGQRWDVAGGWDGSDFEARRRMAHPDRQRWLQRDGDDK